MSTLPFWARPGVKVVCIKRKEWVAVSPEDEGWDDEKAAPSFGGVYTIRWVTSDGYLAFYECGKTDFFNIKYFRPLTEISESDDTEARLFHSKGRSVPAQKEDA